MLNQCTLAGRLTADLEVSQMGDSTVASCLIEVDRDRPNGDGEREADNGGCIKMSMQVPILHDKLVCTLSRNLHCDPEEAMRLMELPGSIRKQILSRITNETKKGGK